LVEGENLHPRILAELPIEAVTVLDVGAGSGRLTLPCAARAAEVLALEPAAGLRRELAAKLQRCGIANVRIIAGSDQAIPLPAGGRRGTVPCLAVEARP